LETAIAMDLALVADHKVKEKAPKKDMIPEKWALDTKKRDAQRVIVTTIRPR
jgi:hypothetical protein